MDRIDRIKTEVLLLLILFILSIPVNFYPHVLSEEFDAGSRAVSLLLFWSAASRWRPLRLEL
jgi:hypothetical protein